MSDLSSHCLQDVGEIIERREMGYIQKLGRQETSPPSGAASYICWTRMQAEAGQNLDRIIKRKEAERTAGNGVFFWGVGNAPAALIPTLSKSGVPVPVVFSVMKSAPKATDVLPNAVVVWNGYIDARGIERPLPAHALVLSRRDSPSGMKKAHYALVCHSEAPLTLRRGEPFDHRAFCNASDRGAPVGASQVTALLRPTNLRNSTAEYEANMRAVLTGSYWVRLTRPSELSSPTSIPEPDSIHWVDAVAELRMAAAEFDKRPDGQLL